MKLLLCAALAALIGGLQWRAFQRRTAIDAWASARVAALIRSATPARWPEVR